MISIGEIQDALEKREPTKPDGVELRKGHYVYHCGACSSYVYVDENFCCICGRKIDWGKE